MSLPRTQAEVGDVADDAWPQWRGPTRDSILQGGDAWPDSLTTLDAQWRVVLGPGYSGPLIIGNRVFITETHEKKEERVLALDRRTGRELWRASWPGAMSVPFFAKANGDWIRATPASDGDSLFVAGMRDVLVCLCVRTGEEKWRVDFPSHLKTDLPSFGFVSSPLVIGDFVYVQAGAGFVKLNKRTGDILWRTLTNAGGMDSDFSSPVEAMIGGVRQLVVQTRQSLTGVDPETGKVLWSQVVPAFRGMNILTPLIFDNHVFTSSYRNGTFCYRVNASEGVFRVEPAWTTRSQGYMSSPVLIDAHAYLHLGNGRLCCVDLRNGTERWTSQPFGKYWSMIANRDRILALDERGKLLLIQADPSAFRLLDQKSVAESESWAHLAVSGRDVLIRDLAGITLYRWP